MTQTAQTPPAAAPPPPAASDPSLGRLRTVLGFALAVFGLLIVLAVFLTIVLSGKYSTASDATAILGAVTGVVGTIVAAFFGIQTAASGQAQAQAGHAEATRTAVAMAAAMNPAGTIDINDLVQRLLPSAAEQVRTRG